MWLEVIDGGTVTSPRGFRAGAAACGLKESGSLDLALLSSDTECTAAGLFTKNQVVAAPVVLDRQTLSANDSHICGVVANAGNANACTGEAGMMAAQQMQRLAAEQLGCRPDQVLVLSTGVIGVPLPVERVAAGLRIASKGLSDRRGPDMAQAIMTTDTRPKQLAVRLRLPDGSVTIGGVAKGSGMIHPNMATMLAVLTTDAAIPADDLKRFLQAAVDRSFNCISIDGDTSTNDSVLLLANGASGLALTDADSRARFVEGLERLCVALAKQIVRDGEGVSKFVEIVVGGAPTNGAAKKVAETIATSPLVKTALAGSDPNWGRILAAAGRAGVPFDQHHVGLWIGNGQGPSLQLLAQGTPTGYMEEEAAAIFARRDIHIRLDLGQGQGQATMWTGDLTHDYVTINADYRT